MLGKQCLLILLLKFWALVAIACTVVMLIFFFDILDTGIEISVQFGTDEEQQLHTCWCFCSTLALSYVLL